MGPVHCLSIWAWSQGLCLKSKVWFSPPCILCLVLMTASSGHVCCAQNQMANNTPAQINAAVEPWMSPQSEVWWSVWCRRSTPWGPAQEQQWWRLVGWDREVCILKPLVFIWASWFSPCTHVWSTSYAHTSQTLNHSFVIFKRRQTPQEREACKYVPMLLKPLLSVCKKDVHWEGKMAQWML